MSAVSGTAGRLRRLLAIVTWLAQAGEAPIDEVAERFDLTPAALVAELEMAACCGVPPFSPDQLMEILVTETTVAVRPGVALARARRLTPSEGFAVAAAARALLAVAGSDEGGDLSTALAKLERALGRVGVEIELDDPPLLPVVRDAVASQSALDVTYYSASSDRVTDRVIAPQRLFAAEGHWYVDAYSSNAEGLRRFRVDRITDARQGEPDDVPRTWPAERSGTDRSDHEVRTEDGGGEGRSAFVPGPESRKVRLSIDPGAAWLVESVPAAGPPVTVDGRVDVELFVGGLAWLERLLLRLGAEAVVVEPAELQALAADAALRILHRYGRDDEDGD